MRRIAECQSCDWKQSGTKEEAHTAAAQHVKDTEHEVIVNEGRIKEFIEQEYVLRLIQEHQNSSGGGEIVAALERLKQDIRHNDHGEYTQEISI